MSKTRSDECMAKKRQRIGWVYVRVRRFYREKLTTHPKGTLARCNDAVADEIPMFSQRDVLWASVKLAARELAHLRDPDPRCYVTPSYSGGDDDAYVDGKLRRPMCFGSRREAWAQPHGTRWTLDGELPAGLQVIRQTEGWTMLAEGARA